jgi:putative ABC transport system permease protein
MWRDLRLSARSLARSLTFTLTATLALGLATGANATIFALIDGLWFRPPGISQPDRLVRVFSTSETTRQGLWSWPEFRTLADGTSSVSLSAIGRRGALLTNPDGTTDLLLVNVVSARFFQDLGVAPAVGRLPGQLDEDRATGPVVALGHALWRRRYGGDPAIVGRTLPLGRGGELRATVIGVLPASFRELEAAADRDLWMPTATWEALSGREDFIGVDNRWFEVIGVRRAGASEVDVSGEIGAIAQALARDRPAAEAGRSARVVSDLAFRLETGGTNAIALLALVLLVVLITCVNVAHLLLARASEQSRDLAIQVALGASRARLLRRALAESAIVGACGAGLGLIVALWLVRVLPAVMVAPPGFPSYLLFAIDSRAVLFTLAVAAATTALFALGPSTLAARANVSALMLRGGRSTGRGRGTRGLGPRLIVLQVAVSLVLLSSASVLARSFLETRRADLGFARRPLLTAWTAIGAMPRDVIREGESRLAAIPGVRRVAVAIRAPLSLSGGGLSQPVSTTGRSGVDGVPDVKFGAVGPNYFDVMGTPLVAGRAFTSADELPGEPVAIVSEAFVARFLAGGPAVGETVAVGRDAVAHRVVGVVRDVVVNRVGETPEPYFYLPYGRVRSGEVTFLLETDRDATASADAVRAALRAVDPRLDPRQLVTMAQYVAYSTAGYRATATLAAALGLVGLVLTALGVYGVMAYRTTRRTREIGIRLVLGANRGEVLRMVSREGARLGLTGLVIGVPASLIATRLLQSMLFQVGPWDVPALVGAAGVLGLTLSCAVLIPAWRATRVNPSQALRD